MTPAAFRDVAERCLWTAVQAGGAVVVAAGAGWVNASVWQAAGVAAGAAVLSVIKNVAATRLGDHTA